MVRPTSCGFGEKQFVLSFFPFSFPVLLRYLIFFLIRDAPLVRNPVVQISLGEGTGALCDLRCTRGGGGVSCCGRLCARGCSYGDVFDNFDDASHHFHTWICWGTLLGKQARRCFRVLSPRIVRQEIVLNRCHYCQTLSCSCGCWSCSLSPTRGCCCRFWSCCCCFWTCCCCFWSSCCCF